MERNRKQHRVLARYLIMDYLMDSGFSESEAGAIFGLDHSTAHYGKTRLNDVYLTQTPKWSIILAKEFRRKINAINKQRKKVRRKNNLIK